ncbi:MAG: flagellar FliJ family protein, partial [Anaerotignaceae bacterium]
NVISEMCRKADSINAEFNERKARGITVIEASKYSSFLRKLETDILGEYDVLYRLKAVEEEKREAVVEMKIETSTLEMLKKQKLAEYDKLIQKSNELFVEEFVSRQRVVNMMH